MHFRRDPLTHVSLPLFLFFGLMALLWVTGGASRGDAVGQLMTRAGACAVVVIALLGGGRPDVGAVRPVFILLIGAFLLVVIQLIPLPAAWWAVLPGRDLLPLPNESSFWRPISMVPGATLNSLFSLIVPAATLLVFIQASDRERLSFLSILVVFVVSAVLLGLAQFAGSTFNNPLINDVTGNVSSVFANRNHFALLVAIGCILLPVWAFTDSKALRWRGPFAAALVLLFILVVIAIGSRAGLVIVAIALALVFALVGKPIKRRLHRAPPWVFPALAFTSLLVLFAFVAVSFFAERVEAIDRLLAVSVDEDLRTQSRPTIFVMIWTYFPWGAGLGSFDFAFRLNEPDQLLAIPYFNQAHNDYLGIMLDAGLPGLILLLSAIIWWASATFRVVRAPHSEAVMLARLGSAMLLLIFVASVTDYPARTPIIMAFIVIGGAWLAHGCSVSRGSTLPQPVPDL